MNENDDIYILPNVTGPTEVIHIDASICIGCNKCADICRTQTIMPSPEKGEPPILVYPDECWFCGCCVEACPTGALEMRHPISRRLMFKRKGTGEVFRIGQKDPPPKSYFKAPYGDMNDSENLHKAWAAINDPNRRASGIFTEGACRKIASFMHEPDCLPDKVVKAAELIGFDSAFINDSDGVLKDCYVIMVTESGNDGGTVVDAVISAKDFVDLFHRSCVSMYTAVQVWRSL